MGVINAANAGLGIFIYDGVTLLGSTAGVHGLSAYATNALGTGLSNYIVDLVAAAVNLIGGGQIALFSGSGDAVSLSASAGLFDSVLGSNGAIYPTSAQATVSGGAWDSVIGSNGVVELTSAMAGIPAISPAEPAM